MASKLLPSKITYNPSCSKQSFYQWKALYRKRDIIMQNITGKYVNYENEQLPVPWQRQMYQSWKLKRCLVLSISSKAEPQTSDRARAIPPYTRLVEKILKCLQQLTLTWTTKVLWAVVWGGGSGSMGQGWQWPARIDIAGECTLDSLLVATIAPAGINGGRQAGRVRRWHSHTGTRIEDIQVGWDWAMVLPWIMVGLHIDPHSQIGKWTQDIRISLLLFCRVIPLTRKQNFQPYTPLCKMELSSWEQ